jgi:hypothetical protein
MKPAPIENSSTTKLSDADEWFAALDQCLDHAQFEFDRKQPIPASLLQSFLVVGQTQTAGDQDHEHR